MHILIAVLGAAAALVFFAYRLSVTLNAGKEAYSEAKGLYNRAKWSRRIGRDPLNNLEDPREAGAILMLGLASLDGPLTERQGVVIKEHMARLFGSSTQEAEDLFGLARFHLQGDVQVTNVIGKIVKPVLEKTSMDERRDLIAALEAVSEAEGPQSDLQVDVNDKIRRKLLAAR